ncbi:MAG: hypothetical protein IJB73_07765 [Firmicutes bacterium]|nr:hypothetical protein [Bacillota bacterium]
MKIGIVTKNNSLIYALARRTGEISSGIEFVLVESEESPGDCPCDEKCIVVDEDFIINNLPVKKFLGIIEEMSEEENTSCRRFSGDRPDPEVWVVRSLYGGSGCSSIAVVLARIMAGKTNGKILIVSLNKNRPQYSVPYIEVTMPAARPSRELEYLLHKGVPSNLVRYTDEDRYGPLAVSLSDSAEELLKAVSDEAYPGYIIVDAGTDKAYMNCSTFINVGSAADMRTLNFAGDAEREIREGSKEIYIINRAPHRKEEGYIFSLPDDPDSFVVKGNLVEIAMDGSFAASLKSVAEKILDMGQNYE